MLDRGLRRRFDRSVEMEAQRARDEIAREPVEGRSDLRELATFTIDPVTAKDFDDAISAQERDDGTVRVWVHIADVSAFVRPGRRRGPRGGAPQHERLRPGARGADAAGGALQRRMLAAAARRPPRRHGADGRRRRRAPCGASPSRARSSAPTSGWTTRASTGSSPARRARPSRGRRRCRPRARPRAPLARRRARGQRAGDREPRAGVRLRPQRPRRVDGAEPADRVAPAHRAPDDRGERAGRPAPGGARRSRRCIACTRRPSPRPRGASSSSSRRSGSRRRRCGDHVSSAEAAEVIAECSRRVDEHVRRARRPRARSG